DHPGSDNDGLQALSSNLSERELAQSLRGTVGFRIGRRERTLLVDLPRELVAVDRYRRDMDESPDLPLVGESRQRARCVNVHSLVEHLVVPRVRSAVEDELHARLRDLQTLGVREVSEDGFPPLSSDNVELPGRTDQGADRPTFITETRSELVANMACRARNQNSRHALRNDPSADNQPDGSGTALVEATLPSDLDPERTEWLDSCILSGPRGKNYSIGRLGGTTPP